MQLSLKSILALGLAANTVLASPALLTKRLSPDVGTCIPIDKLRQQLITFTLDSATVLFAAPSDPAAAQAAAQHAVDNILSPIDLLNPQVQSTQDLILADLATVGSNFKTIAGTSDPNVQRQLAITIQNIM